MVSIRLPRGISEEGATVSVGLVICTPVRSSRSRKAAAGLSSVVS